MERMGIQDDIYEDNDRHQLSAISWNATSSLVFSGRGSFQFSTSDQEQFSQFITFGQEQYCGEGEGVDSDQGQDDERNEEANYVQGQCDKNEGKNYSGQEKWGKYDEKEYKEANYDKEQCYQNEDEGGYSAQEQCDQNEDKEAYSSKEQCKKDDEREYEEANYDQEQRDQKEDKEDKEDKSDQEKCEKEEEAITHLDSSPTFQVMKIVSDKQELGFVEKVHIPESQIARICKQLVPSSIDARNPGTKINYQMLNRVSLPTVGIYGDKLMMAGILRNIHAINESTYSTMVEGNFEAGLYVSPMKHCMVVFYWHQGSRMEEAARRHMSCNFIRYLVDLCDDVCVLVEEDNLMDVLSASASRHQAKHRRVKHLQISHVQNSSNDVCISQGFRLILGREMRGLQNPKAMFSVPIRGPFFSQGHHRCGYIAPVFKESGRYTKTQMQAFDPTLLPSKIKEWYQDYVVDFSGLKNDDFVLFLKHSGLPEFKKYENFKNEIRSRSAEEQRQLSISCKLQQAESKILNAFMQALPEVYSCVKYLPEWGSSNATEEVAAAGSSLEQLEKVVANAWGGQKLVFVGSEITFTSTDISTLFFKGLIESVESGESCPITLGQTFMLRKTGRAQYPATSASFRNHSTRKEETPVLAREPVFLVEGRTRKGGVITEVKTPNKAIRLWVQELVPDEVQNTLRNFCFLCFLMSKGIAKQLKDVGEGFIAKVKKETYFGKQILPQLLANVGASNHQQISLSFNVTKGFLFSGNIWEHLDKAASNLPGDARLKYEAWRNKFSEFRLDESAVSNGNLLIEDWKTLCSEICDSVKGKFQKSIESTFRKKLSGFLQKRFEKTEEEERKILQKHEEEEEDAFVHQLKYDVSNHDLGRGCDGRTRRMSIKSCKTNESYLSWFKKTDPKIEIVVSTEEIEKPGVLWRCTELAPTKKDLDQICLNPMHKINPLFSESSELLRMDPETEELKMVASLKSGELLVFVKDTTDNHLKLYVSPKLGSVLSSSNCIRVFRRGTDLIAFEESTRFLALYDAQVSKVSIYRFDEAFRLPDYTGVELTLDAFSGSNNLLWMLCIPGRSELLLLDDTNRIRIAELHQLPLMKPGHIILPSEFICGCISEDGSFLFLLLKPCASAGQELSNDDKDLKSCASSNEEQSNEKLPSPKVWIYFLGDTISFLKCISLDVSSLDVTDIEMKLVNYGGQKHLVVFSKSKPDALMSYVLEITLATQVLQFRELLKNKAEQERLDKLAASEASVKSSPALEYLYHVYDKFAVQPAMLRETERTVNLHILLKPSCVASNRKAVFDKCNNYLNSLLRRIAKEKGKDFCNYKVQFHTQTVDSWKAGDTVQGAEKKPMGDWMRQLVCLVPVQICRADNNGVRPLVDGLQISSQVTYWDSISLANLLRFGMYDSILTQWDGCIKVISSMGKQSSGKSYLLNHLCGSLLDVAGGRCTDGVWLTVRIVSNCLYVILDFEGLGSFERTEQEDMLLSVLNAALSNLTIFNKKDFHLDKETETLFNRFQEGVSLVKHDEKLFKGLFYVAIKDVDASDVEELKDEFHKKLQQICERSKEDFLSKMYRGEVVIATMPPFTRQDYHKESLEDIAYTIEDLEHSYEGGRSFLRDLKIVIAQIAAKDWTPVDQKRVALKIDVLRKNMVTAVKLGCLLSNGSLVNFDTDEEIPDGPLIVADVKIPIADTRLELAAWEGSANTAESVLGSLRRKLEQVLERRGIRDEEWHAKFQEFLQALAKRRQDRVQNWVHCNTREFAENTEVQKLQLEVSLAIAEVKQEMAVCGGKCSKCFWRCVLNKGHSSSSEHSCMGSHVCAEKCSYCSAECADDDQAKVLECQSSAGHEGSHDCRKRNHTCVEPCIFSSTSSNCSVTCSLKIGHEGAHRCNSPQHICREKCSLPACKNVCVIPIEKGDHEKHACHERYCPEKCIMKGCRRSCGFEDHFHQLTSTQHLCGNEHPCPQECEADGICEILTELLRQTRSFSGKRSNFEYEHVAEQNGLRKNCCIPVPPFKLCHEGAHVHTQKENALHYCDVKCPACGYFCDQPKNHGGLHKTVHGNMRHVYFSAETEEFDIQNRKYEWGESGVAEMCNMHCKAQGRGHIHLINCTSSSSSHPNSSSASACSVSVMYDGARHQTKKYGPDFDVPKDELKHEIYWQLMRFQDPCSEDDRKEFALCNHVCTSAEHVTADGKRTPSYCTEKLWHEPLKTAPVSVKAVGGHLTQDGHAFTCNHIRSSPHHVVFVVDKSGSMSAADHKPQLAKFSRRHNNRLGCVLEAVVRFIRKRRETVPSGDIMSVVLFDTRARVGVEMQPLKEDVVDGLIPSYVAGGWTSYSAGLRVAQDVLLRGCRHGNYSNMKPVVIFLSDGGNTDKGDVVPLVADMVKAQPNCILHTIMFGNDPATQILKRMAAAGNGTFQISIDEVQLAKSFESLANSLKPTVAALL